MYPNQFQFGQQHYGQQYQQPIHGFVYVNGIEGAYAYQLPPNSEMPLFDANVDGLMYVKTTDGAGYPTVQSVQFPTARQDDTPVTHDELQRVYADISSQIEQMKEALNALVPKASDAGKPNAGAAAGQPAADVPAAR